MNQISAHLVLNDELLNIVPIHCALLQAVYYTADRVQTFVDRAGFIFSQLLQNYEWSRINWVVRERENGNHRKGQKIFKDLCIRAAGSLLLTIFICRLFREREIRIFACFFLFCLCRIEAIKFIGLLGLSFRPLIHLFLFGFVWRDFIGSQAILWYQVCFIRVLSI